MDGVEAGDLKVGATSGLENAGTPPMLSAAAPPLNLPFGAPHSDSWSAKHVTFPVERQMASEGVCSPDVKRKSAKGRLHVI